MLAHWSECEKGLSVTLDSVSNQTIFLHSVIDSMDENMQSKVIIPWRSTAEDIIRVVHLYVCNVQIPQGQRFVPCPDSQLSTGPWTLFPDRVALMNLSPQQ